MENDIKNFDNGLEIDEVSDRMKESPDAEIIRQFFGRAETASFIVPYRDKPNTIPLLDIKEKGKMIPIFSSFAAFEKSPLPKDKANIMTFQKVDEIVKSSNGQITGIIMNPHGKSMVFQRNGGKPTEKTEGGVKLMKPSFIPERISTALQSYFSSCENVYAAYVLWMQKENDLAPHLFLIIDFDGKKEEFFPKVAEALRPNLISGDNLEMAKADFKLLKTAEKLVKPVYKKP